MFDLKKLGRSFKYALEGINYSLNSDQNLTIHFIVALLVIILSLILQVTPFEMAILGVTILLVISAEMINTAIEKMVDLITNDHKVEAKIAKDVASGMVLLTAIGAVIIGIIIFVPHLIIIFS
jgi:diacylglycerol kinase (ATP)